MSSSQRRIVLQFAAGLLAFWTGVAGGAEKKSDGFSTLLKIDLPASVDSTALRRVTDTMDYWMIEASVNGQPVFLAIDTGSHQTFLGPRAAARCGLIDGQGIAFTPADANSRTARVAAIQSLKVGEIEVKNATAIVTPLGVEGLLGLDFFEKFVVEFDPDEGRVTFWRPNKFKDPAGATVLPLRKHAYPPRLSTKVRVGEVETLASFDSGHPGEIVLKPHFIAAHPVESFGEKLPGKYSGGELARVRTFHLGPMKLENVTAMLRREMKESDPNYNPLKEGNAKWREAMKAFEVVICGGLTNRFHCYYDVSLGRLLLLPRREVPATAAAKPADPERERSGFGARFDHRGGRLIINEVTPGLAVAKAGVQVGDALLKIDGEEVGDFPFPALQKTKGVAPGTRIKLLIQREGEPEPREVELIAPERPARTDPATPKEPAP